MNLGAGFFAPTPGVGFAQDQDEKEYKPTANANLTWVKGNHTFKFGGEMVVEGFPTQSSSRANALYTFSYEETAESLGVYQSRNRPQLGLYFRKPVCQLSVGIDGLPQRFRDYRHPAGQTLVGLLCAGQLEGYP